MNISRKILTLAAALAALCATVAAVPAQERQCPKVDLNFSCGDGTGGGPSPFLCRQGESENDCCTRWKKRAGKRWCGQKAGGLSAFICRCPEDNDGDSGNLPGLREKLRTPLRPGTATPSDPPTGQLTPVDPPKRTLTPVDPPERTLTPVDPPERTLTPVDPPERTLTPVDPPKRTLTPVKCHRIEYSFTCFNGASSSGKFACGSGVKNRCCRRAQTIAHRGCVNKGMAVRFKCDCLPPPDRPGKLRLRGR